MGRWIPSILSSVTAAMRLPRLSRTPSFPCCKSSQPASTRSLWTNSPRNFATSTTAATDAGWWRCARHSERRHLALFASAKLARRWATAAGALLCASSSFGRLAVLCPDGGHPCARHARHCGAAGTQGTAVTSAEPAVSAPAAGADSALGQVERLEGEFRFLVRKHPGDRIESKVSDPCAGGRVPVSQQGAGAAKRRCRCPSLKRGSVRHTPACLAGEEHALHWRVDQISHLPHRFCVQDHAGEGAGLYLQPPAAG